MWDKFQVRPLTRLVTCGQVRTWYLPPDETGSFKLCSFEYFFLRMTYYISIQIPPHYLISSAMSHWRARRNMSRQAPGDPEYIPTIALYVSRMPGDFGSVRESPGVQVCMAFHYISKNIRLPLQTLQILVINKSYQLL